MPPASRIANKTAAGASRFGTARGVLEENKYGSDSVMKIWPKTSGSEIMKMKAKRSIMSMKSQWQSAGARAPQWRNGGEAWRNGESEIQPKMAERKSSGRRKWHQPGGASTSALRGATWHRVNAASRRTIIIEETNRKVYAKNRRKGGGSKI
jgi:hypothetical protein